MSKWERMSEREGHPSGKLNSNSGAELSLERKPSRENPKWFDRCGSV